MNNVATGELTPAIRQQLVNVAHSLQDSADSVRKSLVPPQTPAQLKGKAQPTGTPATAEDYLKSIGAPVGGKK